MLRRPCLAASCPHLARPGASYCPVHDQARERGRKARRAQAPGDGAARRARRRLTSLGYGQCAGCLKVLPSTELEVDHRVPLARGGEDTSQNLQILCCGCHRAKTAEEARAGRKLPT